MKKLLVWLLTVALFAAALPALSEPAEADGAELAEWTVMFYLCGSDLESKHGYASGNLAEFADVSAYAVLRNLTLDELETPDTTPEGVNVVVETGGSEEWHAQELWMDIDPKALQRWHYRPWESADDWEQSPFELVDERPLASMASPQTLADFIRWGAERYPAKKYALVLWDHGGGSKTGIFIDELFDGDTLYLDELRDGLAGGGVYFEAVVFDACLMANIETAYAIKDSARWMIASEEVVAGKGTAVGAWLQQLYLTPQADGERLGRWICDMTQEKYANEEDAQAQSMLTLSVIDLAHIERLAGLIDRFFEAAGLCYANDSYVMMFYTDNFRNAFQFGLDAESMIDLSQLFSDPHFIVYMDKELYNGVLDALARTVVYNAHGPGRAGAGGLSMCYAAPFSAQALETYARNCPLAHYLAFLDAINPSWTAPDWVYERARLLPEIEDIEDYRICVEKTISANNTPGVAVKSGIANVGGIYADLYRLDEETGFAVRLGCADTDVEVFTIGEDITLTFLADDFGMWPAVEGVVCDVELVKLEYLGKALYNIPVQIGADYYMLRCGHDEYEGKPLTIYGLWEGYDADSTLFNRNVTSLSKLAGQEYCLLYPIDDPTNSGKTQYQTSEPMTMYRALEVAFQPLAAGTYYLDYWVKDMFSRRLPVGRAEVYWDGERVSLPSEDSWQGEMTLTTPEG